MVGRCWLVRRGSLMHRGRGIGGLALVLDVHHIARVGVIGLVGDNLGAAVGEEDAVRAIGGIAVTGLLGTELNIALVVVLGIDAILVLILWGCILVGGLLVRGSEIVGQSRLVGFGGGSHSGEGENGNKGLR